MLKSDPARPRWRLRYVLALIGALFILPAALWLVWGWIEAARLDRALDVLEARHEPLDLAEFDVKPTTDVQKEASHLYAEASKLLGDRLIPTVELVRVTRAIEELCALPLDPPARGSQIQAIQAFEEPYAKAFALLDRASQLDPVGWADADRPQRMSMEVTRISRLATANGARIARLACTGNGDLSATALLATIRLRRVWILGAIPGQTAHGLGSVLTLGSASPALLQQIQQEYASAADDRALEKRVLAGRANWLSSSMPGVFSDPPARYQARRITPVEAVIMRLVRPLSDHRMIAELREFDEALDVAKQPWPAKLDAVADFVRNHPLNGSQSIRRGVLELLTRPYGVHAASGILTGYLGGTAEALARTRASVGAVAVARYQRDHGGAMPEALQQLIPGYLPAPLIDPFSGADLKFRHDATGYRVYSVGSNRKDDGGEWEQQSDLQLFRRGNPLDIGIAVGQLARRPTDR